jgi:hypothetical protein
MDSFDVDAFLKKAEFEVVLKGKKFVINDISEELVDKFKDPQYKPRELLQELLGCTKEDLAGYGTIGLSAIIKKVTDHFFQSGLLGEVLPDLNKPEQSPTSST